MKMGRERERTEGKISSNSCVWREEGAYICRYIGLGKKRKQIGVYLVDTYVYGPPRVRTYFHPYLYLLVTSKVDG